MTKAFFLFIHLAFFPVFAASIEEAVQELVMMVPRPTVTDMKRLLTPWPKKNPFASNPSQRVEKLPLAAESIASMERVFPGATWAAIGRDAVMLGDILDAFYQSLGQKNRVVRLNGSGDTIRRATKEDLLLMLESAGLNLKDITGGAPFIVFDDTGYLEQPFRTSQARLLVKAAYQGYQKMGGDPTALAGKVGAMNCAETVTANFNPEKFHAMQLEGIRRIGIPDSVMGIKQAKSFIRTEEWHGPFGPLMQQKNNKFEGAPGMPAATRLVRQYILGELYEIINAMRGPKALKLVRAAAKELNYEFPVRRIDFKKCEEALISGEKS